MEVTALKDQAETCRHFADRTIAERGVRYGRVATTPTSAKTKRHPKAYLAIETPVVACPFRVKLDQVGRGDTSLHVRSTPNTGRKFNASVPVPLCQTQPIHSITSPASASSLLTPRLLLLSRDEP